MFKILFSYIFRMPAVPGSRHQRPIAAADGPFDLDLQVRSPPSPGFMGLGSPNAV